MDENSVTAFWSKVEVADTASCWEWKGARKIKGYGNVRIGGKFYIASRVAWELANFKIPDGYSVLHICDNPPCCNPSHLVLGTSQANYCDMLIKKRQAFHKNKAVGTRNYNAKLDDEKIREIRRLYASGGYSQQNLAARYGVSQVCIGAIVRCETWKHVE